MTRILTEAERATLNEAMAILQSCTPERASRSVSTRHSPGCSFTFDVAYYDSREIDFADRAHHWIEGETFADKVQTCLDIEAALPTPEAVREAEVARLRAKLAELEQV